MVVADIAFVIGRMSQLLDGTVNFENEYSGRPIWSGDPGSAADAEVQCQWPG